MATLVEPLRLEARTRSIFGRVLAGVDGSREATEAAKQAALLAEGPLTLLTAYEVAAPVAGATGSSVPAYLDVDVQRLHAARTVARAREDLAAAGGVALAKIGRGAPWDVLVREARANGDTLVVVGSHGIGRARGILLGSTVTELVHRAPCSVLVTRGYARAPSRIAVGVDGSPESASAYAVARALSARFQATLRTVVAEEAGVDVDRVTAIVGDRPAVSRHDPVEALVLAGDVADLVVVGSRGLHGLQALGSVSERVVHRARAPVLVVRVAPWQRPEEPEVAGE